MNRVNFMLLGGMLLSNCVDKQKSDIYTRVVFDLGELKFFASSVNKKQETMAALYGNDKAYQTLSKRDSMPTAGTILRLVTWRYHDNPQYTGGTINGELLSVESVYADETGNASYQLEESALQTETRRVADKQERIKYIMSYKPVF